MEALQEIKLFLEDACEQFHDLSFKVGYGARNTTYIVEVYPLSEYENNEEFAEMGYRFSAYFESESHPECTIIFKSPERILFKVEKPILEVKYNPVSYKKGNISFDFSDDLDEEYASYKYSLAA